RMRQTRNEALIDGIVDRRHDYGNGTGGLPHRPNDWRGIGDDYVGRERHQFCRVSPYAADVAPTKARLDLDVAAFGPAQFTKSLQERCEAGASFRIVCGPVYQHADAPHPLSLLRARRQRPRRRAAEQRDELAAHHLRGHSITSSARSRNDEGTLTPS